MAGRFVMAFVMDAIESVDIAADTTFALMLEAQRRGHELLYLQLQDLGVRGGQAVARAAPISLRREPGRHFSLGEPRALALDEADFVFQRKDPPVNAEYAAATQILSLCRRALVWNDPRSLLSANEKLYALHFANLMPATLVSREIPALLNFLEEQGGEMVVKPLDGKAGEGIFHLRPGDPNLHSILEQSTAFGARWAMAQAYLPEVRRGDKRILLLEGEPLGAVLRVPADGESRANFHAGGRAARAGLDSGDRRIIERIAPRLRQDGLFFVGIDVIGGHLTEINVTSPTGLQEMNALDGARYEERIIERIEALLAARR
ncbi:MAG: glutathione synthase [Deltaproteobacteria bacterium]|nr:glutathione synthase [Deltaproteobacteria bacterium]